ncbi:hypothetical protein THRCLA_22823, partial [Thraustotheca clavata]
AYAILSDEEKRQTYNRFGKSAVNGNGGGMNPNFNAQNAEEIFQAFFGGQDPFNMFFQQNGMGGQRVHVSNFGGPGFAFHFGGPGMRARHPMHQARQRHEQEEQAEVASSGMNGGNLLLVFLLLWMMGVPLSYLWVLFMIYSYFGSQLGLS